MTNYVLAALLARVRIAALGRSDGYQATADTLLGAAPETAAQGPQEVRTAAHDLLAESCTCEMHATQCPACADIM